MYEKYPVKEKLATNLTSQVAWLAREMGYSRDKTKGYEEKLVRLGRDPDDPQSVFGFMGGYWHRFNQANSGLSQLHNQLMATKALQANAKVVAGLSDKVAFSFWLQSQIIGETREPEWLLDTSLDLVTARVNEIQSDLTDEELLTYTGKPFEVNPMGKAILGLHESFKAEQNNTESLRNIAIEGSANGVLMWQAYARSLESQGFDVTMPKPGLSSGNIEDWN
ncbi:MAG TPA: hypothetical protein VGF75_05905 [Candidatus Saccharimonadales bacterium]